MIMIAHYHKKPSSNLEFLVIRFNNATPESSNDPEKISSPKYYDNGGNA